jgi:hypothetical protein
MKGVVMNQKTRTNQQSGSAVLAALAILAVTFAAVGVALFEASQRFGASHQSSRWSQAAQAAEAGAEVALVTAQQNSWVVDGWSAAPGAPGTAAVTKTVTLDSGVPATGPISASIQVDKIAMGSTNWLRIRSKGVANLTAVSRPGVDFRDVILRKLSLRKDRSTGAALTTPQAIRTIEVLAQPASKSPFQMPLLLDKKFTMSGGWVDSFDSSDPAKSTGGLYDIAKRQSNGDVGINDTQSASNLGSAFVYGDLSYGVGAPPTGTTNVQGTISGSYNNPVTPISAPTWTSFNATPTIINTSMTLTGGTQSSPALYKVSSVTVPGGKVLTLAPLAAGVESYIEIWVTGSFTTSGSGYILQQPGVHVTYHIQGDITVSGSSFNNQSNIAANNIIEVVNPPSGTTQKVTVSGGGTFIGAINAPGADFTLSGSASFSGALIGKTMNMSGGANLHYDEALGRAGGSTAAQYKVGSWVEAVR